MIRIPTLLKRTRRLARTVAGCSLLLPPSLLSAQAVDGAAPGVVEPAHERAAPRARAVRTSEPISLDGRLDESIWSAAPPIRDFTQLDPEEGAPASQPTEVRIAYDDESLYVGALLHDSGAIITRLARRDASLAESDVFVVVLDSYHDHRTAYRFATNPSGMKQDELISSGGSDSGWDPVWDVSTERTAQGWTAEMRIPFSQLRFPRDVEQTWGLQLERIIQRNQENALFAFTSKLERSGVQRYGHLDGISGIRPGRRLEILAIEPLPRTVGSLSGNSSAARGEAE